MQCFNRSLCRLQRQTAKRIIIMLCTFFPPTFGTPPQCKQTSTTAHFFTPCSMSREDPDSIIIIQDVFIPVDIMKHCDTMAYISLFRCQCHPYWITRAGGRDVPGLEGRKDVVEKKIGGGDANVTSWFIVLSWHRQPCIRSFFPPFFSFFLLGGGEGGSNRWCYYGCLISQVPTRADTN